ncbi:MAG: phosphatidylserine decarboxylase [Deltaproteobacteria bacterium]|nr:phosphatidylserine decarboxylase [Deltaproteobacteria bacterium]
MYALLSALPKNHLSYVLGSLAAIRLPGPLRLLSLQIFAKLTSINLEEAERPLREYASIADLFTRRLRAGARPIEGAIVSPADSKLRACGVIENGRLPQIKDKDYSVAELLRDPALAERFNGGYFFNLYLSPMDYHRVHAPCAGAIEFRRYIPGKLWPVNDWSLSHIENLFVINERVVIGIRSAYGLVLVIMVGATNVGKISLAFDSLVTNRAFSAADAQPLLKQFDPTLPVGCGDELGTFHLGSSVVVLFEPQAKINSVRPSSPAPVRMGQLLAQSGCAVR